MAAPITRIAFALTIVALAVPVRAAEPDRRLVDAAAQQNKRALGTLLKAGADVNAVNEAKFTALHGAAFRGLNEVIEYLVKHGADINAQDFIERTAFRIAEGSKQTFQFQEWPETAEFIRKLGADPSLGVAGRVQERQREVGNKNQ